MALADSRDMVMVPLFKGVGDHITEQTRTNMSAEGCKPSKVVYLHFAVILVFYVSKRPRHVTLTVRSLAPICSSTTSTMFSEPCFKQTHTAKQKLIKRKDYCVGFLGTS